MSKQACKEPGVDPDDWFAWPGSARSVRAKQACMTCPFYWGCQEYALNEGIPHGVWGGVDERERERIWARTGGRPGKFHADLDAAIGPLLQYRRDLERDDAELAS